VWLMELTFWQRAIPILLVVLASNLLVESRWFRDGFPKIYSAQLHFHRFLCSRVSRPIAPKWVRLVEIDDTLHQQLGDPTNRQFLASIVDNSVKGGAITVVLDVKLVAPRGRSEGEDIPERQAQNAALLQAIKGASERGVPVVLGCWLEETDISNHYFERIPSIYKDSELPFPDPTGTCLYRACAHIGNINLPPDRRQLPTVARTPKPGACSESLSLAAVSAYEEAVQQEPRTRDKRIIEEAMENRKILFTSFIPESEFQKISAQDLGAGNLKAVARCRGRIIIIGGKWHRNLGRGEWEDVYESPVGEMAGMYLHANYIESLLDDRYQRVVPIPVGIGLDILIGLALYWSFHRATTGRLAILAVFFLPLLASYVFLVNLNFYVDFILPLSICFAHLTVELTGDYVRLLYFVANSQRTG